MRRFPRACLILGACLFAAGARASVSTSIDVTNLHVDVSATRAGATPGVSFVGTVGSTSQSDASCVDPPTNDSREAGSGHAFGAVATSTAPQSRSGGAAMLSGDAFGAGAAVHTSAFADSLGPDTNGGGTLGLVDGVSAARFALAPGTRLTITADIRAMASATGASEAEYADSGLSFTIADLDGVGPQFFRFTFDAFATGLFGAYEDVETASLELVYENDSDAPIMGLISGYVASVAYAGGAVTAVPEPAPAALLVAGLLALHAARRRRAQA